ncbi:MAG: metal-dependent hydrolase [Acidobacteria bacterium]|nr:metal-dependent hydrolase [Acidobacteriota bacterium]
MDTITHGIAGALIAKSFFSEREGRVATWAVTLGSLFPDSDSLANLVVHDPLVRLEIHRGITHSLLALPLFALLFGAITCLWTRQRRWLVFTFFYAVGIASHILLDVITSFGTMIWSPWSYARVAWDTSFIIDFTFTSILLLPQLVAWVYSDRAHTTRRAAVAWAIFTFGWLAVAQLASVLEVPFPATTVVAASAIAAILLWAPHLKGHGFEWRRSSYCRAGFAAAAIYLSLCGLAHQNALDRVEEFARRTGLRAARLAALPAPPTLWRWSGLVETPDGVYRIAINLADAEPPPSRFFANAEKNQYVEAAEGLEDVKTYLWFARFPWVTYRQVDELHVVEYRDIQFFWPRRGNEPPFTLRVSLDRQGRLVSSALVTP